LNYKEKLWYWDLIRTILNLTLLFVVFIFFIEWYYVYAGTGYWFYPDYTWFGTWLDFLMGPDVTGHQEALWWTVPVGFASVLIFDRLIFKDNRIGKIGRGITILSMWVLYVLMWFLSFIYYLADPTGQGPIKSITDPYDYFVWSVQLKAPWLLSFGLSVVILGVIPISISTYLYMRATELEIKKSIKGITKIVKNIATMIKMLAEKLV